MRWAVFVFCAVVSATKVPKDATPQVLTTNAGKPIDDVRNSETVNWRGPILLEDPVLLERLQIQNRERIPERVVHARGAVAKGTFTTTSDWMKNVTFAAFLQANNTKVSVACRWSTVIHSVGSPEFLRDPRGFAIKFYTEQGNYDIVGLDFPVFFIRDGIRFPEMIRALKPNPVNGQQEWWRIWDYFSNYPESTHMFSWLMDDVGIPASYREVDGYGVHTYKWISPAGKETFVRYYYQSQQGVHSLPDDEATKMPFSFATADLFDNIDKGNFPKWTVYVQMIPADDKQFINSLSFDILDTTKQWPPKLIPYHEIGILEFNENPISQFLENEQIAFSPGRMVPGIEPSDEKMLQTRVYSYMDTQRYRLGVNNQMLPINKPKCPFLDWHYDGQMNFLGAGSRSASEVNYFPSRMDKSVVEAKPYFHQPEEVVDGMKVRHMINKTNDFQQPGERWRSFPADRQDRFAHRVGASLSGTRISEEVVNAWLGYWKQADPNLEEKIKGYITLHRLLESGGELPEKTKTHLRTFKDSFLRASGTRL